ncbi:MAG: CRISPR-associated endonuclease Cas2 [Promethearchaeota archaeon]
MLWFVAYDIPATHDRWRFRVARELSNAGLFRIQYSVFMGELSNNAMKSCKLIIDSMLSRNRVPADIRFLPLCRTCEKKALRTNTEGYTPGKIGPTMPSSIVIP